MTNLNNTLVKKVILLLLLLPLVFITFSCATNPFTDLDPYVAGIGDAGDYVFTSSNKSLISEFVSVDKITFNRISGSYNPLTHEYYGALEGKFSKIIAETGLNLSGQFTKEKVDNITIWKHNTSSLEVMVPASGIILFASKDLPTVYDLTYKLRDTRMPNDIKNSAMRSESALYINNPVSMPDIGLDLSESSLERFDYIFLTANGDKYKVEFTLTTQEFSDSFFKLIKMAYTTAQRQQGNRPSVDTLKTVLLQDSETVLLMNQKYTDEMILNMIEINI